MVQHALKGVSTGNQWGITVSSPKGSRISEALYSGIPVPSWMRPAATDSQIGPAVNVLVTLPHQPSRLIPPSGMPSHSRSQRGSHVGSQTDGRCITKQ